MNLQSLSLVVYTNLVFIKFRALGSLKKRVGAGEIAQKLEAPVAHAEDTGLVLSAHNRL